MQKKEIQINGELYFELESQSVIQLFSALPEALMWQDQDLDLVATGKIATKKNLVFCLGQKKNPSDYPFITDDGTAYAHAALISSWHEKKSRRPTILELVKWCNKNGFWINKFGRICSTPSFDYANRNNICEEAVKFICTWDGKPMEPTAENMGLEE